MFFEDSRPDRKKRALRQAKLAGTFLSRPLEHSPIPAPKPVELLSFDDVMYRGERTLIYDVECYPNYWLCGFKCLREEKYLFFEITPDGHRINGEFVSQDQWNVALAFVMQRFLIISFNGIRYDVPMIQLAIAGVLLWKLKEISDEIIQEGVQSWEVEKKYACKRLRLNHIDIMEVAPLHDGLKTYAGRLHVKRMQELPYPPHLELTPEQADYVRGYNVNDLDNTGTLYQELLPQIELREALGREFGLDLRSKSDAQVAQEIINGELEKVLGDKPKKPGSKVGMTFRYTSPLYVEFDTPELQQVLRDIEAAEIVVGPSGHVICPRAIEGRIVVIGGRKYKIGMGGLHSQEKKQAVVSDENVMIIDRDVTGYYPNLMLKNGFYPEHLGPGFLVALGNLVDRRTKAKKAKIMVTADGLKIATNGTFGKTSDPFSTLYDPPMMVATTLTGQLSLLMLIRWLERAGIPVVSANTDGIVIACPRDKYDELLAIVAEWEKTTALETEETRYKAVYSRDVNNYIAVKYKFDEERKVWLDEIDFKPSSRYADERNGCKTKGIYSERGSALNSILSKNPETFIVNDAVEAFLARGVPVEQTITESRDVRRFVSIKKVAGGAEKDGVYLGKVVRWYYATGEEGAIHRVTNANQVGKSMKAKPLMDLPDEFPDDVDFDWYINAAVKALYELGHYREAASARLF